MMKIQGSARKSKILHKGKLTLPQSERAQKAVTLALFLTTLCGIRALVNLIPYWTEASTAWHDSLTLPLLASEGLVAVGLCLWAVKNRSTRSFMVGIFLWVSFLNLAHFPTWAATGADFSYNPKHSLERGLEDARDRQEAFVSILFDFYTYLGGNFPFATITVPDHNELISNAWISSKIGRAILDVDSEHRPALTEKQRNALVALPHRSFIAKSHSHPVLFFEQGVDLGQPHFSLYSFGDELFLLTPDFLTSLR